MGVAAFCVGVLGFRTVAGEPGDAPPRPGVTPGTTQGSTQSSTRSAVGGDDGRLDHPVDVFDDRFPAVTHLDPALLGALRDAATAAAGEGVVFSLNSGWRSAAYQEQLLREAVAQYGSAAEAARWVATPATSPHVRGEAVDVGDVDAVTWLAAHGTAYDLCSVYANEPWHFELRPGASERGCPARYADATQDPRMRS